MTGKEAFFKQFPNGCPSCGGPWRHITFTSLVKKPRGFLGSIPWLSMMGMAGGEHSHFAECEICHEAFVYQQDSNRWVNADKVRKSRRRKGKTTKGQGRAHDKKNEIRYRQSLLTPEPYFCIGSELALRPNGRSGTYRGTYTKLLCGPLRPLSAVSGVCSFQTTY